MTKAIILAGGLGTRLNSVLSDLPKPLAPINGKPFLEYQMDYWIHQGVDHFVLSVGYLKEKIVDYFGDYYQNIPINYAIEDAPLDTGGGLLKALDFITSDEPILVLNGDTFFEVDLKVINDFHLNRRSIWTFSLFRTKDVGRYMGIHLESSGKLKFMDQEINDQERLANGGVYLINPSIVKELGYKSGEKKSLEKDILKKLSADYTNIYGIEFEGQFIDIGVPNDYKRAASILT
jgi:D-glycero-alpha-D-manno-heptose 1-phosphate guanylyltransferase